MASSRRGFLNLGLVVAAGYADLRDGAPAIEDLFEDEFDFELRGSLEY